MDDLYKIIVPEEKHLAEMYSWNAEEKNFIQFTWINDYKFDQLVYSMLR